MLPVVPKKMEDAACRYLFPIGNIHLFSRLSLRAFGSCQVLFTRPKIQPLVIPERIMDIFRLFILYCHIRERRDLVLSRAQ